MIKKIHFMGIGGSGISGVAELAQKMGFEVSGCDLEEDSSYSVEGINVLKGHSKKHLKDIDLVIVTPAIFYQSNDNEELLEAKRINKLITWQQFVADYLQKDKEVICIAGTHGKSTTTAMVTKLLEDADLDPITVMGAKMSSGGKNYRYGNGKYFVTEADEFFDNFINYHPQIIILNNIEYDHPDYFKSKKQLFESYVNFVKNLTGKRILIVNIDDDGVNQLLSEIDLENVSLIKYSRKENDLDLNLKILGEHNLLNALGVVALGKQIGINDNLIKKSLESFNGIGRRMELVWDKDNIKLFDDYAHHPTAIRATLKGLRSKYPQKRIWAIIEPHGFSRTKELLNLYKDSFRDVDKVIIGPIFKARDKEDFGVSPNSIVQISNHNDIVGLNSFEEIKNMVNNEIKPNDILIIMGAGKSYLWAKNILKI